MDSLTKEMVVKMVQDHGFYLEPDEQPNFGTLHIRHLAWPDESLGYIRLFDTTIVSSLTKINGGVWITYDDTLAKPKIHNALQNLLAKIRKEVRDKAKERVINVKSYFEERKRK